jgi:hypothetical protein
LESCTSGLPPPPPPPPPPTSTRRGEPCLVVVALLLALVLGGVHAHCFPCGNTRVHTCSHTVLLQAEYIRRLCRSLPPGRHGRGHRHIPRPGDCSGVTLTRRSCPGGAGGGTRMAALPCILRSLTCSGVTLTRLGYSGFHCEGWGGGEGERERERKSFK